MGFIDRLMEFHRSTIRSKFNATNDWNMYVRVLTTQFDSSRNVTDDDLAIAMEELEKFDLVTVLEMPDTAVLWKAKYGMEIQHKNVDQKYNRTEIFEEERRNDNGFDLKYAEFEREFRRWNRFDYILYDRAKELHRECF